MRVSKTFLTVDAVIFKIDNSSKVPSLLLIKRKNEPFKGKWALPGGFVNENEDLAIAAKRELKEETSLIINDLKQLQAFGKPFRDPRQHTVSVAFMGFADDNAKAVAADDASEVGWFLVNDLPELAFDHTEIVNFALDKIKL